MVVVYDITCGMILTDLSFGCPLKITLQSTDLLLSHGSAQSG